MEGSISDSNGEAIVSDDSKVEIPNPEPASIPVEGKRKKKKKDGFGSARGVETMFRTSYRTHQDLSNSGNLRQT